MNLLNLPKSFLNDYSEWLLVTTAMKNLNKYEVWNEWSNKSETYHNNNRDIWNSNDGMIDINYLINVLNKNGNKLDRIHKFKPYEPLTENIKIRTRDMNSKYVYEKNMFRKKRISIDTLKNTQQALLKVQLERGRLPQSQNTLRHI